MNNFLVLEGSELLLRCENRMSLTDLYKSADISKVYVKELIEYFKQNQLISIDKNLLYITDKGEKIKFYLNAINKLMIV